MFDIPSLVEGQTSRVLAGEGTKYSSEIASPMSALGMNSGVGIDVYNIEKSGAASVPCSAFEFSAILYTSAY